MGTAQRCGSSASSRADFHVRPRCSARAADQPTRTPCAIVVGAGGAFTARTPPSPAPCTPAAVSHTTNPSPQTHGARRSQPAASSLATWRRTTVRVGRFIGRLGGSRGAPRRDREARSPDRLDRENAHVPRISAFYGIVIWMYSRRDSSPRPTALPRTLWRDEASLTIETVEVLAGALPPRALRLVTEWASDHQESCGRTGIARAGTSRCVGSSRFADSGPKKSTMWIRSQ
jgi:hypothetical protein